VQNKSARLLKQIHWNRSANPMESFSKINGIVERIHWNSQRKLPSFLQKTARKSNFIWRLNSLFPLGCLCNIFATD
jgi:hypothetical protein